LYALQPLDRSAQRLMLLTNLDLAKVQGGFGKPLPVGPGTAGAAAMAAGAAVVSQVLSDALAQERIGAAIAAAEILGVIGDASVLHATSVPSPLATAMRSGDRRVRLAAALAAAKLDPSGAYAGSGYVAETLAWFITSSGRPSVLVGHPHGEQAQALVAFLSPLGYDGESAYTGRVVSERLFADADFAFLLVSDAIDGPPVEELVQWLRRDYRTSRLPIGVMARSERVDALRETLKDDALVAVFSRIHSPEVAARSMAQLEALAGRNLVGGDERLAEAERALAALNALAANDENLARYDLFRHEGAVIAALHQPVLSAGAAKLLARLGTPTAQVALLDLASQSTRAIAERQAAAEAFAAAVRLRGLRLTQAQVLQQYERYNASASLDQGTQVLLGGILDVMEQQAAKVNE
jgi:hypothetical protein